VQSNDLMALVARGDGVAVYAFILCVIDLRFGAVQDKLQLKYNNMKVSSTDSIAAVSKQIDLKWFLHKNHVLFNVLVESGRREGIRNILKMLLDGPGNVGTEAILSLSQVDLMDFASPDSAENWVKVRLENYQRYGDLLVGSQSKGYKHLDKDPPRARSPRVTEVSSTASRSLARLSAFNMTRAVDSLPYTIFECALRSLTLLRMCVLRALRRVRTESGLPPDSRFLLGMRYSWLPWGGFGGAD